MEVASIRRIQPLGPAPRVTDRPPPADGPADSASAAQQARGAALADTVKRHNVVDPATRTIVYQTINAQTGDIVREVPDQALLRLKVYSQELRAADAARATQPDNAVQRIA